MHIAQLTLTGFKSFVEPTSLLIAPGLTGVIGPNGCGKSNLLEALRWVMGETSSRSMRAGGMDDVIFSGTDHRPSRNHASVTVRIERPVEKRAARNGALGTAAHEKSEHADDGNGPGSHGSDTPREAEGHEVVRDIMADLFAGTLAEIEICRTIARGAGSSYTLNGKDVRARDVRLLFEDAATGARSHALVRQGQIGEIIRAKPEQRRRILEDAAGIAGLHARRHEAELKLNATLNNLERLKDVVDGLDAQRNALQRQARQARRYRALSDDIAQAEAFALFLEWQLATLAVAAREATWQTTLTGLAQATKAAQAAQEAVDAVKARIGPARDDEMTRAAVLQRVRLEAEGLEREAKEAEARRAAAQAQLETLDQDVAREEGRALDLERAADALAREIKALEEERDAAGAGRGALETAAAAAQAASREARLAFDAETQKLAALRARHQEAERARAQLAAARDALKRECDAVARLKAEANAASAAVPDTMALDAAVTQARDDLERVDACIEAARSARETAQTREREHFSRVGEAELKLARLSTEIETLDALTGRQGAAKSAAPAGRQREGKKKRAAAAHASPAKTADAARSAAVQDHLRLMDVISVAPGFENLVAALFADRLQDPVIPATDAGASAHHWQARSQPLAKTAPHNWPTAPARMNEIVHAPEDALPELADYLSRVMLSGDRIPTPADVSAARCDAAVSACGTVVRAEGHVGTLADREENTRILEAQNRLSELRSARETAQQIVEDLKAEAASQAGAVATAEDQLRTAMGARDGALRAQRDAEQALVRAQRAAQEAENKRNALATRASLQEERAAAVEAQERACEAMVSREGALGDLEAAVAAARGDVERKTAEETAARVALTTLDQRTRQIDEQQVRARRDLATNARQQAAASDHAQTLKRRRAGLDETLERLATAPEQLAGRQDALREALTRAEKDLSAARDALAQIEADAAAAEKELHRATGSVAEAREARARAQAELDAARTHQKAVRERIAGDDGITPDDCLRTAGDLGSDWRDGHVRDGGGQGEADNPSKDAALDPAKLKATLDALAARLAKLRAERDRLGGVNLQADDDLRALDAQRGELAGDLEDLEGAVDKLRRGITSLNRAARQRLMESFNAVNRHFQHLFATLFGGGQAELKLIENDDPLQAGLELIARPPGKKPAALSLLSGGEQALTAMALIFAVFLTNPSPICVLDEVDAPLDDANVERFCTLLEWMRKNADTRFLVITHHPMTMARMDRLFGVTMAEKGVSKLVSVDLLQAREALRLAS